MSSIPWYRTLAWRAFMGTGVALLTVLAVVMVVARQEATAGARAEGTRALRVSGQVLDHQIRQEARVLDASLEVFALQSWNVSNLDEAIRRQDRPSAQDTLQQNLANLRGDAVLLVTPDGRRFASTMEGDGEDVSSSTALQMALDPEGAAEAGRPGPSYVGFHRVLQGAGQGLYLLVARPLVLPGGTRIGALAVGMRLGDARIQALRDLIAPPGPTSGHLAVLSRDGIHGATLDASAREALQTFLGGAEVRPALEALQQGQRSLAIPWSLNQQTHLLMISPLRGEDGATLGTATVRILPLEPYAAPFLRIQRSLGVAALAGLLVALLLALASARRITAPLHQLTRATTALVQGERLVLNPPKGGDEVAALTGAFQHLLEDLRAKEELLADLARLQAQDTAEGPEQPPLSRVSLPGMDLDATAYIPDASRQGEVRVVPRRLSLREGDVFDQRYRIEAILGKGGMGVVFRARDLQLDEDVAVKVIHPDHGLAPEFLEQLKQELKLARRITHRHVLRTHDFGEAQGVPYVTMEYLRGVTLFELLCDRGRLPLGMILRIGRQVADGLDAAHGEGVVHRDIKPHNVFFDWKGDVKVLDFGLAAPLAASGMGAQGHMFGTPRYMAPEQVRGEAVDPRTDLYALGVMLFELASGTAPFVAEDLTEQLRLHLQAPVPPLRERIPDLHPGFVRLVEALLAKDKEARPGSAAEVAERLKLLARDADATHRT